MKPKEERYFFGEEYRLCYGYLHVVRAFRAILIVDVLLLLAESATVPLDIRHLDAMFIVELCVSITCIVCAGVEMARNGHYLIWPYIILKAIGFLSNCFVLFGVTTLFVSGNRGRRMLREIIRWRYRVVQEDNLPMYAMIVFALSVFQMAFGSLAIRWAYRCLRYNRKRAIAHYDAERRNALRVIHGHGGCVTESDRRPSFMQWF